MTPDHINASFELVAAFVLWLNFRRLWRDRELKGVSVIPTAFYALWCVWNIYYYAHLGQWLSWYAGLGVGVANLAWVVLALWVRRRPREQHRPEDGGPGGVPRAHNHTWRYVCTSDGKTYHRCPVCGDWDEPRPF